MGEGEAADLAGGDTGAGLADHGVEAVDEGHRGDHAGLAGGLGHGLGGGGVGGEGLLAHHVLAGGDRGEGEGGVEVVGGADVDDVGGGDELVGVVEDLGGPERVGGLAGPLGARPGDAGHFAPGDGDGVGVDPPHEAGADDGGPVRRRPGYCDWSHTVSLGPTYDIKQAKVVRCYGIVTSNRRHTPCDSLVL